MLSRRDLLVGAGGLAGISTLPLSAAGHKERLTMTKVELFRVCPPLQEGVLAKSDTHGFDKIPKFMLKVHTDSGIVGLGETHRMGGGPDSAGAVQLRRAAEALRGKNVLDFYLPHLQLPVDTDVMAFGSRILRYHRQSGRLACLPSIGWAGATQGAGELLVRSGPIA